MFLRLTLPTGVVIDSDIIRNSYSHIEVYYNDLKPADDSIKMQVPFTVQIANAIKGFTNEFVSAVVYDDDSMPVFTGYLRKESAMIKQIQNGDISVELVPPSYVLDKKYGDTKVFINKTVSFIISQVLSDIHSTVAIDSIPVKEIKFAALEEKTNVLTFIKDLLFECGYVYTFTNTGKLKAIPLFDRKPEIITQVFTDGDSGNMYGTFTQKAKERKYDSVTANFDELVYKENQLIFDDTSERVLEPGSFLFDNIDGEYVKYDCDGVQSVLHIYDANLTISKNINATDEKFTNFYTKGLLRVKNTSDSQPVNISRIRVTGSGYFVKATSQSKTTFGDKSNEISLKYTFDSEDAEELVKNICNYYRYSGITLTVVSKENFPIGSFCEITAEGAGTYTCRILKKTSTLTSDMVKYELESILEYVPAEGSTDTSHASNTGNVLESFTDPQYVSPIEKQGLKRDTVVIHDEYSRLKGDATALNILSSIEYAAFDLAHTNLELFIDESGIFNDMTVSTVVNREELLNLMASYYSTRDALSDKITVVYVESQSGASSDGAVPVMDLSAPVVAIGTHTEDFSGIAEYFPPQVDFSARFTNGEISVPYKAIFEVYCNDEPAPAYRSETAELSGYFVIPQNTKTMRIVMYDAIGQVIYDNEPIDFVSDVSGVTLHLSNKFQSFFSGSLANTRAGSGATFETEVLAYVGTAQRPVYVKHIPDIQGMAFRSEDSKIFMTPTGEIEDVGTFDITGYAELMEGVALGIGDIVVGIDETVAGDMQSQVGTVSFTFYNIEAEIAREDAFKYTGRYRGTVYNENNFPVVQTRDYILYVGTTTEQYKKGHVYQYNGIFWAEDNSNEHMMATLDSMLPLFDSAENEEFFAKAFIEKLVANTALIDRLFTRILTIRADGQLVSEDYIEGESGFCLKNITVGNKRKGFFEVTDGVFRGNIETGPMFLSNEKQGEETFTIESGKTVEQFYNELIGRGYFYSESPSSQITYNNNSYIGYKVEVKEEEISSDLYFENILVDIYFENTWGYDSFGNWTVIRTDTYRVIETVQCQKKHLMYKRFLKFGEVEILNESKTRTVFVNKNYSRTTYVNNHPDFSDRYHTDDDPMPAFSTIPYDTAITTGGGKTFLLRDLPNGSSSSMPKGTIYHENGVLKVKL